MSFAAGASVAYVFVHLLPELQAAREVFVEETAHLALPFPEYRVYLSAMIGFMFFYGLEHLVGRSRVTEGGTAGEERAGLPIAVLHTGGFAVYVWLVSYLMVNSIEEGTVPVALYAVAMGFHFLTIDHALRREHGSLYERSGRYVIALASLAGWVVAVFTELPKPMVITLLGLVSGAVIMNSMVMELPREKEGRFLPFLLGGILYTGILLLGV